ncbi:MAG TPA: thioredoxin domain-containing protein, partial [Nitrososphaeraceae archaeon]|nr:thioredoxin domain-containing protein [Nitrososphaeraceae archaeon]
ENPRVASAFRIQSIPTVAIFKNSQMVDGFVGVASKSQIQSKVSQYMGEGVAQRNNNQYNSFYS